MGTIGETDSEAGGGVGVGGAVGVGVLVGVGVAVGVREGIGVGAGVEVGVAVGAKVGAGVGVGSRTGLRNAMGISMLSIFSLGITINDREGPVVCKITLPKHYDNPTRHFHFLLC
jgi:hypothetical protein